MDEPKVLVSHRRLEPSHLQQLFRHEATAVHVREFYPTEAARQLGRELAGQNNTRNWKVSTTRGLESSDVFTAGKHAPFNVASSGENREREQNEYFDNVLLELDERRWRPSSREAHASEENALENRNSGLWICCGYN